MAEESGMCDDDAITENIRRRVANARFGDDLLAKGQSVVVLDEHHRVVRISPSGHIEILSDPI